jgi:hypothetical protein
MVTLILYISMVAIFLLIVATTVRINLELLKISKKGLTLRQFLRPALDPFNSDNGKEEMYESWQPNQKNKNRQAEKERQVPWHYRDYSVAAAFFVNGFDDVLVEIIGQAKLSFGLPDYSQGNSRAILCQMIDFSESKFGCDPW